MKRIIFRTNRLALAVMVMTLARHSPAFAQAFPREFSLTRPESAFRLLENTPRRDFRVDFSLRYEKPGVVFDTIGINTAPIGSWALMVDKEGRVSVQVYDPAQQSSGRLSNGWHVLTSSYKLATGQWHRVTVDFDGAVRLRIGKNAPQALELSVPLSGQAVWVGDFPDDDHWGKNFRIHPAFVGTLTVHYAGPTEQRKSVSSPRCDNDVIVDETHALSREEIKGLKISIDRVETQFNLKLALAFVAPADDATLKERATQLWQTLSARGALPAARSVLFLFAGNSFRYHRDSEIDSSLSSETVHAAWESVGTSGMIAMRARQFLENLLPMPITLPVPEVPIVTAFPPVVAPATPVTAATPAAPVTAPSLITTPLIAAQIEKDVRALESACRAGRLEEVKALLTPKAQEAFVPLLSAHQDELLRLADLLTTGRLQVVEGNYAEWQVTEDGCEFAITFEKRVGVWRLASF